MRKMKIEIPSKIDTINEIFDGISTENVFLRCRKIFEVFIDIAGYQNDIINEFSIEINCH